MAAKRKGCVAKSKWPKAGFRRTTVDVKIDLYQKFKKKCDNKGITFHEALQQMMRNDLNRKYAKLNALDA